MNNNTQFSKHIYWMSKEVFYEFRKYIAKTDYKLSSVSKTPCETLKARDNRIRYASPSIFDRLCTRQSSWYRNSDKAGMYLVVSAQSMPDIYHRYLDATISESDFLPAQLPDRNALKKLVKSEKYRSQRPDEWEKPGLKDSIMFKVMFSLTGFWGWGDNLKSHWLNHRANHANFLSHQYTTEIDGEDVAYSVTDNDGVCSSCAEFFNIIEQGSRKMVRACPGSITFAGVKRNVYYDVNPVKFIPLQQTT